MSSPTVIIGKPMRAEIARSANRDAMDSYLAQAKQVYDSLLELSQQIAAAGGNPVQLNVLPFAEAEARARAMFESTSDGFTAVQFAHGYWRSLKHPLFDQSLKRFGAAKAEQERMREREAAKLNQVADSILSEIKRPEAGQRFALAMESAGPQFRWDNALDASVHAIFQHTSPAQAEQVSEAIFKMAVKPSRERLLAFESLRLSLEQQDRERMEQEGLKAALAKHAEVARRSMDVQITRCEAVADWVGTPESQKIATDLVTMRSILDSPNVASYEDRLSEMEHSLMHEKAKQTLLQATIEALRRQGYQQVEVMGTIRPEDVGSVYLLDPEDENRMTLLRTDEATGRVAAMVVAREKIHATLDERKKNLGAQTRLCKAMDVAERVLSQRWKCELLRTKPGAEVQFDRRLADVKVKSKKSAVQQKQQQRSIHP